MIKPRKIIIGTIVILSLLALVPACSTLGYYSQAISGHLDLISRERPVAEVIEDKASSAELKRKLVLSQRVRQFASEALHLPDNDSYKQYADLERPYVVWNVVATPAYSIKPKEWCYFIVGCLSYRGVFDKQEAEQLAAELKAGGQDVSVFGTAAYSTLGYFDDPLLNTMLRHGDTNLIGIIFHELAHQTVYVENDTAFNEAFATAVEQEGLRRWFDQVGKPGEYETYLQKKIYRHEFYTLISQTRRELENAFTSAKTKQEKQKAKEQVYLGFKHKYKEWREARAYFGFDQWMQRDLNNSHLALIATYQERVPTFIKMLASVNGDMKKFYEMVRTIGEKDKETRRSLFALYKGIKTAKNNLVQLQKVNVEQRDKE